MKALGHTVKHYGHKDSKVDCDYHTTISDDNDLQCWYGKDFVKKQTWKEKGFSYSNDRCRSIFYDRLLKVLKTYVVEKDFICVFDGSLFVEYINTKTFPFLWEKCFVVEPQIGHCGPFYSYRVYTSHALRIFCQRNDLYNQSLKTMFQDFKDNKLRHESQVSSYFQPHSYAIPTDTVIPYCIDPSDFKTDDILLPIIEDDYFVFIARIATCKGLEKVIYATELENKKLVVAGPGSWEGQSVGGAHISVQKAYSILKFIKDGKKDPNIPPNVLTLMESNLNINAQNINIELLPIPPHVTFVGFADLRQRKSLLYHSKAFIIAPTYEEPFGKVSIESLFMGKPIITSARGGYNEVVEHGKTGFLCNTLSDMRKAIQNVDQINPEDCKEASKKYTLESVQRLYDDYFKKIYHLSCPENRNNVWYNL